MRDRHQQLPQVHGREPGKLDHLRLVLGSVEGLPGSCWPVLEGICFGRQIMKEAK